jgi:two-component system, chemotaxis family, chemotaxis protein CheY
MVGTSTGVDRTMRLPATLDQSAANELFSALQQKLTAVPSFYLDATDVEVLTLPCSQIILAAIRSHGCVVRNPSEAFRQAFNDLALSWQSDRDQIEDERADSAPVALPEATSPAEDACATQEEPMSAAHAPDTAQDDFQGVDGQSDQRLTPSQDDGEVPTQESADEEVEESASPANAPKSKRIMTIDDSKTMRDMLKFTLVDAGFDVLQGVDGQDGLNVLGDQRVDVIITDINMPIMDGYEVIRQLRLNPVHKSTPILVLTTESDKEKRGIARSAGATGWMVKPFEPEALIATINKVSP